MSDVTQILNAIDAGDPRAAKELLPLVYDELRKLASAKMAQERPDHSLNATALVHEAYLRLVGDQHFDNRGHFFAAAAEAMRRILIENARSKGRNKRGGQFQRADLDPDAIGTTSSPEQLLDIDEALDALGQQDAQAANLIKLRFYAGLSVEEAAEMVGLSRSTAYEHWAFARAWIHQHLTEIP